MSGASANTNINTNKSLQKKRIIINKINQIGDVTFALPLASILKKLNPTCTIIFLAKGYVRPLVEAYADVDEFADWDLISKDGLASAVAGFKALNADIIIHVVMPSRFYELSYIAAKEAKIPVRLGVLGKLKNWRYCNRFVHIARSKSGLHETQLDLLFAKPFGGKSFYSLNDVIALRHYRTLPKTASCLSLLDSQKFNLILHPKTRGEHIEWPAKQFAQLIRLLSAEKFNIFVTGSMEEGDKVRADMITPFPHVHDLCGKVSLADLIQLIAHADGMICASTGPVHLAANFGIHTLGLYAPIKPFDSGRWGPVGKNAEVLCIDKSCEDCRHIKQCHCIAEISPLEVLAVVQRWGRSQEGTQASA